MQSNEYNATWYHSLSMSDKAMGNSSPQPRLDELITLSEAAKICRLSPDHLRRLVRRGNLWGMKIGRNWVTTEQAAREYVTRDRKPGPKPRI